MVDIYKRSIEVILKNQSQNGAYIASPEFETYGYSWIRDGSYIAYAMDIAGEHDSADKFYAWVNDVIKRYSFKVEKILQRLEKGEALNPREFLFARYTLEGIDEKGEDWGNFQLDGYGTWLWGLSNHIELTGSVHLIQDFSESINATIAYISNLWYYPNYDIWEENSDKIHTSTLACLYGGLYSINKFLKDLSVEKLCNKIRSFILTNCSKDGEFIKYVGSSEVDSSLIWLAIPFGVVDLHDEFFKGTVKSIEEDLLHNGGTHRYKKDTYYGGGEWILLSSWMGWYYIKTGNREKAFEIKRWIEAQADEEGNLPEQVSHHVNDASYYPFWVNKWGKVASPLLWSHAMYLILSCLIKN